MEKNSLIKKYFVWIGLVICGSLLLSSCKDKDDNWNYAMSNQDFVNRAASSNNLEIAAGTLARDKGTSETVKNYGIHMITDHTAAGQELKGLAAGKGWAVPEELAEKDRAEVNRLNTLTGATFDREFAQLMVKSHQEAVALFETASANNGIPDGDLRQWAASKLPTLRHHLQEAITLRESLGQ